MRFGRSRRVCSSSECLCFHLVESRFNPNQVSKVTPVKFSYNQVAGRNLSRLEALSDGIFAVAMTLLVLDLHSPVVNSIHSNRELWQALLYLAPQLGTYIMSIMVLGIFWVGQQTQFNHLAHSSRDLTWIHIAFLFFVSIMPFSTSLLASFITYRVALLVYWSNIFLLGAALYLSWTCATETNLLKPDTPPDVPRAIKFRIISAQGLYALGALLCLINTYWSIAVIALVQLNYAIAPRVPRALRRRRTRAGND